MKISKVIILLLGWLVLLPGAYAQSGNSNGSTAGILADFYQGAAAYRQGDYPKAIESYESILRSGKVSGPIYYNLANSYFKAGKLGKAVLNYERARTLIPRDGDLSSNYEYALAQVKSMSEAPKSDLLKKIFRYYSDGLTADELSWIVFGLLAAGLIVHLLGLWLRWPRGNVAGAVAVLAVLLVFNLTVLTGKLKWQQGSAFVIADTQSKFEPRDNATTHFDLAQGWRVEVLDEESGWLKVRREDDKVGWVKKEALERL